MNHSPGSASNSAKLNFCRTIFHYKTAKISWYPSTQDLLGGGGGGLWPTVGPTSYLPSEAPGCLIEAVHWQTLANTGLARLGPHSQTFGRPVTCQRVGLGSPENVQSQKCIKHCIMLSTVRWKFLQALDEVLAICLRWVLGFLQKTKKILKYWGGNTVGLTAVSS